MSDLKNKWDDIYRQRTGTTPEPALMLSRYSHLLPQQGVALDLACGLGGNTFFLAQRGFQVDAWDISEIAIEHIKRNTPVPTNTHALATNISDTALALNHYDVITVSRFLDRQLVSSIMAALKPGGLLFYQTFTVEKTRPIGPTNTLYLLARGELLSLFSALTPLIYHDEGLVGDAEKGIRNEAILIAQKP